ncbi:YbaB/EbfC family nucleoid-associated protein [Nocardia sp. NPDC049526]|uniref:YbaB/EbfC family nucleoid-associated protein n=1 Tax=Nocardia sp. NPDC049526 TaxID=3364316 RepID=UPI0037A8D2A1
MSADEELLAEMMASVQASMTSLRDAYQQRAQLTGTGTAADKKVTVVVNADGLLIETRMDEDITELSPDEIAQAVTAAAQQAFTEIKRKTEELVAPMRERQGRMPKLSELLPGIPDDLTSLPTAIAASTTPQASAEPQESGAERKESRGAGPEVTESSW